MKKGVLVSTLVAFIAVIGLTAIFVANASPYLTIDQLDPQGGSVHVVGEIVPKSLHQDPLQGRTSFRLQDPTGEMQVHYTGPPISNLYTATQVVVIGSLQEGEFHAKQMLVKCPSKYEGDPGAMAEAKDYPPSPAHDAAS
jgi:cytochrome c-type biogenesis protein CcmE